MIRSPIILCPVYSSNIIFFWWEFPSQLPALTDIDSCLCLLM